MLRPSPILAAAGLGLLATLAAGRLQADPVSDEARRHFRAGVTLLEDPEGARFEEAYHEFKAAYGVSKSPKILGNLGLCEMKLERDGEAIDAYAAYLRDVKDMDTEERYQVQRDLATLRTEIFRLSLSFSVPKPTVEDVRLPVVGPRVVNFYPAAAGRTELGLHPGRHELHFRAPGYREVVWTFDAVAGSKASHEVVFEQDPDGPAPLVLPAGQRPPTLTGPLVVTGVGLAALLAGAVTGVVALKKSGAITPACTAPACVGSPGDDDARSSAVGLVRATDALVIGGTLITAVGVGWLAWSLQHPSPGSSSGVSASAGCLRTGCAASLSFGF